MCGIVGYLSRRQPIDAALLVRDARHDRASRTGRGRPLALGGRAGRLRPSPPRDRRPQRGRASADAVAGRPGADHLQWRNLQSPRAARASSRRWAGPSEAPATRKCCSPPTGNGARRRSTASPACSPSRSTISRRGGCSRRAIAPGRSRSSTATTSAALVFASELKAILAHPEMPREADPAALDHYLAYGYVPRELCMLKGYAKLPAGHKLRYDLDADRLEVEPYWRLPRWTGGPAPAARRAGRGVRAAARYGGAPPAPRRRRAGRHPAERRPRQQPGRGHGGARFRQGHHLHDRLSGP